MDLQSIALMQGHMNMLWDGGADLVVAQPIHVLGVWGMLSQDILLFIYALKSILVHSETNIN